MVDTVFFWTWPTWAKLSFALGGSLAIVLALASLMKARKMIKIRKLTRKAVADPETANIRLRGRSSDEIPFGAKAMLEDPEVKGVWNSRASTPLQSPVIKPRRSSSSHNPFSRSRRSSSASSVPRISLPEVTEGQPVAGDVVLPGTFDGTSIDTSPQYNRNSSDNLWQYRAPVAHPQHESLPRRRSVTIRASSKQEIMADEREYAQPGFSSVQIVSKRRSRVSTDPTPATPTHELRGRTLVLSGPAVDTVVAERTPTTKKALDRMEAHRKFHAAESGQLQPRLRSLDAKSLSHKHTTSDHTISEHEPTRAVSWPITSGEVLVDFNAPQQVTTRTSPNVVPFRAFVETQSSSKVLAKTAAKMPPSAWTEKTQGMLDERLESNASRKRITIKNERTGTDSKELQIITNENNCDDKAETTLSLGRAQQRKETGMLSDNSNMKGEPRSASERVQENINDTSRPKKLQKKSRSRTRDRQCSRDTVRPIKS